MKQRQSTTYNSPFGDLNFDELIDEHHLISKTCWKKLKGMVKNSKVDLKRYKDFGLLLIGTSISGIIAAFTFFLSGVHFLYWVIFLIISIALFILGCVFLRMENSLNAIKTTHITNVLNEMKYIEEVSPIIQRKNKDSNNSLPK